jgi:polyhydroxybutyrate depolymerase
VQVRLDSRWRPGALIVAALLGSMACGAASTPTAVRTPIQLPVEDCRGSTGINSGSPSAGTVQYGTITVDNRLRDYRLFIPSNLDGTKPTPLVIMLHGSPSNADEFESINHFDNEAAAAGFLAVYPNGCSGLWSAAEGGSTIADVDFIGTLLDRLEAQFQIDKQRLFAVGASAGAVMTYSLACQMANRLVAIASIAGTMSSDACQPARPVSVLEMHGTRDTALPWAGGGPHGARPVDEVNQLWRTLDGCTGDPIPSQSGITKTSSWNKCTAGTVVRLDTVVGGKHTWFGSDFDPVPREPDANAVIWSFFSGLHR